MVRVTWLSPTKSYSYCSSLLFSFCSLAILDSSSFNNDPPTRSNHRANIQSKQQVQLRTIHQNKRKALKSIHKDKARCYSKASAINAENGATVEKRQLS